MVSKGIIESAEFPAVAQVDVWDPWNAIIHNIGETDVIGLMVSNLAGNPGNIVLRNGGQWSVRPPSSYEMYWSDGSVPNCSRIYVDNEVMFTSPGTYTIRFSGVHISEQGNYIHDDKRLFTVTANYAPPSPPVESLLPAIGSAITGIVLIAAALTER